MTAGLLLACAPGNWLRLLDARAARRPVTFWAGSRDDDAPPVGMVYIAAFSRLRFRAPMTPRRTDHLHADDHGWPAGGRVLSVGGWHVEADMGAAEGVTIEREFTWWPRWRPVDWRGPPGPPRKGEAETVPMADEERPWSGWAFERMPAAIGEAAARVGGPVVQAAPAAVEVVSKAKKSGATAVPATRGLFDGL